MSSPSLRVFARSLPRRLLPGALCSALVSAQAAAQTPAPSSPQPPPPPSAAVGSPSAAPPPPAPPDAVTDVHPPELLVYQDAIIADAERPLERIAVALELTIDATGHVSEARTVPGVATPYDAAVIDAARRFIFRPATVVGVDGERVAVPVVLRYDYWVLSEPDSETTTQGTTDAAPEGAPAELSPEPSEQSPEEQPPPASGPPQTSATATDAAPRLSESLPEVPHEADDEPIFEATAEVEAPPREPTTRTMKRVDLVRMPGTRGDPLRAIEVLPGVAQSTGDLPIIRGAAGNSSVVMLDGSQVPFLYHFGGLTSFVHPRLVEQVDLYPGNFSARYGRATGGIVEARLRKPKREFGLIADVNMIDSSLLVEGPITDKLSFAVAGRRSYVDLVFDALVPDDAFTVTAAPVYYDYQGILSYDESRDSEWRLALYGSSDAFELVFSDPLAEDPSLRGALGGGIAFHRLQLMNKRRFGSVRQNLQASVGTQALEQHFGPTIQAYFDIYEFDSRAEWQWSVADWLTLIAGADIQGQKLIGAYRGPAATAQEGVADIAPAEMIIDEATIDLLRPAVYAEARVNITPGWLLLPGMRVDYYDQIEDFTFDPRLSQRVALTQTTTLTSGVGLYSQPPIYHEAYAPIGNPALEPMHSLHTSLGVEETMIPDLNLDVEGFYKHLSNRVVGTELGEPPTFINDGTGRIYGVEFGATYRSHFGLSGQLSYTLSRSLRTDRDESERPFDNDQPHILNAAATYEIGAGWEVGSRFRYISGNPSTPVLDAAFDAQSGVYVPRYGAVNSSRDAAFHQLDVRVQKAFVWRPIKLSIYLDVQNVYNSENPQGYEYSYDYKKRVPSASGFLFPALGVRGEL